MIVVISKDKDFSHTVAEQVQHELSLPCSIADNNEAAEALAGTAALVVTTENDAKRWPCAVIAIDKLPLRLPQLLADIAAQLQKQAGDALDLGQGYGLHARQKRLMHAASGKGVDLTDKEVQLLECLAETKSESVSKKQLLKQVWGIAALLDTHTLETHIYRLRGKLRELAGEELIAANEGGYRLAMK